MDDEKDSPKSSISSEASAENARVTTEPAVLSEVVPEDVNKTTEPTTASSTVSAPITEAIPPEIPSENVDVRLADKRSSPKIPLEPETVTAHLPISHEINIGDGPAKIESPIANDIIPEDGAISPELLIPNDGALKDVDVSPESPILCEIEPCTFEFGEGGIIRRGSDEISWQHFPRSTSTISSCHLSSDEKKDVSGSKSSSVTFKQEKSEKSSRSSVSSGPVVMSVSQLEADHYLRIRYVFEFFNYLIGHLVANEPENPVQFLVNLINRCILARQGEIKPPLLFTDEHVHSVYRAFDPFARGSISLKQYEEAMRTLGLKNNMTPYDRNPSLDDKDFVKESTFKTEVKRLMLKNFEKMTRIPKNWEENRLTWLKRMAKRAKRPDAIIERAGEMSEEEEVCAEECICEECPVIKKEVSKKNICPYPVPHALRHETALKHEPEQLYL